MALRRSFAILSLLSAASAVEVAEQCVGEDEDGASMLATRGPEHHGAHAPVGHEHVPDTRAQAEGWLRWFTTLEASNSPLRFENDTNPKRCHAGVVGSVLYIGGLVVSTEDWPDHPLNINRECHVPASVRWIVTPIVNVWDWLCGEGSDDAGPVNTREELLASLKWWGNYVQHNLTFELEVDGERRLSKAKPEDLPDFGYTADRVIPVGPPKYCDPVKGIPTLKHASTCGIHSPHQQTLGAMSGYFVAIPVHRCHWSPIVKGPRELTFHAAIPNFAFDVTYRFHYHWGAGQ